MQALQLPSLKSLFKQISATIIPNNDPRSKDIQRILILRPLFAYGVISAKIVVASLIFNNFTVQKIQLKM